MEDFHGTFSPYLGNGLITGGKERESPSGGLSNTNKSFWK